MAQANEDPQEDVVEEEEQTSPEQDEKTPEETEGEETVTIPKSKFTSLKRKATAYDANKTATSRQPINNNSSDTKRWERMELKVEGYDDQAIDFLLKNGGKKALENEYIVSAIEAMKVKKTNEAAMLGNEGQKSTVEKRYTPGEFSKMSSDDQLKAMAELNK